MLSIKECEKEVKQLGLEFQIEGTYRYQLITPKAFDEKAYEQWKEKKLAFYKKYDESQLAYYRQYYPTYENTYKPILKSEKATEKGLRRTYNEEFQFNSSGNNLISLSESTSVYSCAIEEFGSFTIGRKNQLFKHWDLLLQWFVNKTKYHYLKCATPVKPMYKDLRAALKKVGFEMRGKEKSNHGKYFVEVWEFVKPVVKVKRKK